MQFEKANLNFISEFLNSDYRLKV